MLYDNLSTEYADIVWASEQNATGKVKDVLYTARVMTLDEQFVIKGGAGIIYMWRLTEQACQVMTEKLFIKPRRAALMPSWMGYKQAIGCITSIMAIMALNTVDYLLGGLIKTTVLA